MHGFLVLSHLVTLEKTWKPSLSFDIKARFVDLKLLNAVLFEIQVYSCQVLQVALVCFFRDHHTNISTQLYLYHRTMG